MEQVSTIGLDVAKPCSRFMERMVPGMCSFRKRITRAKPLSSSRRKPGALWRWKPVPVRTTGREIARGHHVRLIAPVYVKPFVKRQKNDAADAEAICEAAQRPSMRFVPVKTEEQQANGIVFRACDLLVQERTQCVNALRGHLMEYGYVFPKGITHVEALVALVQDGQEDEP